MMTRRDRVTTALRRPPASRRRPRATHPERVGLVPGDLRAPGGGADLLGQRLGHADHHEEDVEDGDGGREGHHQAVAVHVAQVGAERRARHQAGGERRRHLRSDDDDVSADKSVAQDATANGDGVANDGVANGVANDAVANDAVANDAVANDAVANDAITNDAVANAARRKRRSHTDAHSFLPPKAIIARLSEVQTGMG